MLRDCRLRNWYVQLLCFHTCCVKREKDSILNFKITFTFKRSVELLNSKLNYLRKKL